MAKSHTQGENDYLTVSQLAAEWHVSSRTINRYIADGKLAATKLPSGNHRIARSDADAALTKVGPISTTP